MSAINAMVHPGKFTFLLATEWWWKIRRGRQRK
jgi:hypothetical protein